MKKTPLLIIISLLCLHASSQRLHIGLFGGLSAYNGDLTEKIFPRKLTNGAIGITASYELSDQFMIRSGLTYAVVGGADRYNKSADLVSRNLSFESSITELSFTGEFYLRNLYEFKLSPYAFAGLAVYRFNPYTYDGSGQRVFLKPLSTEGQGIAGYTTKPYSLTQLAIPFGGGIKYAINNNLRIGLELGMRKLFTDFLDDVSGNYADETDLINARGALAAEMAYRGDDAAGGSLAYPAKGSQRGSPKYKDVYYFSGLHLTYRLNAGAGTNPLRMNRNGCPVNIY